MLLAVGAVVLVGIYIFFLIYPFLMTGKILVDRHFIKEATTKVIDPFYKASADVTAKVLQRTPPASFRCAQERRDYYKEIQDILDKYGFYCALQVHKDKVVDGNNQWNSCYSFDLEQHAVCGIREKLLLYDRKWLKWLSFDPFMDNAYLWYEAIWGYIYSAEREYIGCPYRPKSVVLTDKEREYVELCVPERIRRLPRDVRLEMYPYLSEKILCADGKEHPLVTVPIMNPPINGRSFYHSEEFIEEYERLYRESSKKMDYLWSVYDDKDLMDMNDRVKGNMEINMDYFPEKENPHHGTYDENTTVTLFPFENDVIRPYKAAIPHNTNRMWDISRQHAGNNHFLMKVYHRKEYITKEERNEVAEYMILGRKTKTDKKELENTSAADDIWLPQVVTYRYNEEDNMFFCPLKLNIVPGTCIRYRGLEEVLEWEFKQKDLSFEPVLMIHKALANRKKGVYYRIYDLPGLIGINNPQIQD